MTYSDLTSASILADSINDRGDRLTTLQVVFPRFILAEFNTHRAFSRNSASSRAIPVAKQIRTIYEHPFIPRRFPVNRPGMSANQFLEEGDEGFAECQRMWLWGRDHAVYTAQTLMGLGVHKQIANRLLEPFMWHTVIVSATEWDNYYHLRISEHAQPEIDAVSTLMRNAMSASTPTRLRDGEWHLPLVGFEGDEDLPIDSQIKLSAARCARVSYLTHDGIRDPEADFKLYHRLTHNGHLSPLEHPAHAGPSGGNYRGWRQLRWYAERGHVNPVNHNGTITAVA